MNRTIKFRGLRADGKGWVYGAPYFLNITEEESEDCVNKACIITGVDWDGLCGFMSPENNSFVEVIPETVGQLHNGLTKKSGKEVYVGDVIIHDLEAGLGQPKRLNDKSTISSIEFDYAYYTNVRAVGNIHEKEVQNG